MRSGRLFTHGPVSPYTLASGSCRMFFRLRLLDRRGMVLGLMLMLFVGAPALRAPLVLADAPVLPNTAGSPRPLTAITWTTGAGKWLGYWGRREAVQCPAGHPQGAWGTDVYTDDSSICTAAAHAGLITVREGGVVTIEMRPDVGQYAGSARNGVRTGDWMEPWTGAYVFVREANTPEPAIAATSWMQADSWAGDAGRVVILACPPQIQLQTVYGTEVYSGDTPVCSAAVHAGLTSERSGGLVAIEILTGITSFAASTGQGVTSQALDGWRGASYRFVSVPPDTPPPPTADAPFEHAPTIEQPSTMADKVVSIR
jgi:hypothetical protein